MPINNKIYVLILYLMKRDIHLKKEDSLLCTQRSIDYLKI